MAQKGQGLYRNTTSYFGGLIVLFNAALILATMLWGLGLKQPSPYLGILTFMVFPGVMGFGDCSSSSGCGGRASGGGRREPRRPFPTRAWT